MGDFIDQNTQHAGWERGGVRGVRGETCARPKPNFFGGRLMRTLTPSPFSTPWSLPASLVSALDDSFFMFVPVFVWIFFCLFCAYVQSALYGIKGGRRLERGGVGGGTSTQVQMINLLFF